MPQFSVPATTMQDAAVAVGAGEPLVMDGFRDAVIQVAGITSATITWEASLDGTTWLGVALVALSSTTRARALTTTADGQFLFDSVGGMLQVRARISTWVSGTITVIGRPGR